MGTSDFRQYMDDNAALPPDCMLGYIVWYGIEMAPYDATVMEADFMRLGLNPQFLPGRINPADAFEKATMEVHGLKYDLPGGLTAEILVRELPRTKFSIERKLIREIKDARHRRLSHEEVGEFVFYRPKQVNGVVDYGSERVGSRLSANVDLNERGQLVSAVAKFDAAYAQFSKFHDGQRVRKIVRDYLLYLNSILMKSSVYFVHSSRAAELEALQQFINGLNPGSKTSMALLPLPDIETMRVEVTEAFEREAEKNFVELVTEVQKLRTTRRGPIKKEALAKINARYGEVIAQAGEHARRLQVSQDRTGAAAELALQAIYDLQADVAQAELNKTA